MTKGIDELFEDFIMQFVRMKRNRESGTEKKNNHSRASHLAENEKVIAGVAANKLREKGRSKEGKGEKE